MFQLSDQYNDNHAAEQLLQDKINCFYSQLFHDLQDEVYTEQFILDHSYENEAAELVALVAQAHAKIKKLRGNQAQTAAVMVEYFMRMYDRVDYIVNKLAERKAK